MIDRYYLLVDGMRGPKRPQLSLEAAQAEAARLWMHFDGERTVFILKPIEVLASAQRKRIPRAKAANNAAQEVDVK